MPNTLDERITKAKERVSKLEHQRRVEERREREAKKKKDQRRNYIVGEMVVKHFPAISRFEPGTKAENAVEFEPLETFLSMLAADQELVERLKVEVSQRLLSKTQD